MKTFFDLTESQKDKARKIVLDDLVECLALGLVEVDEPLQSKIKFAIADTKVNNSLQVHENILKVGRDFLSKLANNIAEISSYDDMGECVKITVEVEGELYGRA